MLRLVNITLLLKKRIRGKNEATSCNHSLIFSPLTHSLTLSLSLSFYFPTTSYFIRDRKSSNGVRVNDITIEPNVPYKIQDGDSVVIGSIELIFYDVVEKAAAVASSSSSPANASSSKSGNSSDSSNIPTLRRNRTLTNDQKNYWKLVTILPNEQKYDETVHIRAEIEAEEEVDFKKVEDLDKVKHALHLLISLLPCHSPSLLLLNSISLSRIPKL